MITNGLISVMFVVISAMITGAGLILGFTKNTHRCNIAGVVIMFIGVLSTTIAISIVMTLLNRGG